MGGLPVPPDRSLLEGLDGEPAARLEGALMCYRVTKINFNADRFDVIHIQESFNRMRKRLFSVFPSQTPRDAFRDGPRDLEFAPGTRACPSVPTRRKLEGRIGRSAWLISLARVCP